MLYHVLSDNIWVRVGVGVMVLIYTQCVGVKGSNVLS